MTYTICDQGGARDTKYSDVDFDRNLSANSSNGVIYDANGKPIGTYTHDSFDNLDGLGSAVYSGMTAQRDASQQMVGVAAAASVTVGAAAAPGSVAAVIDGVAYTAEQLVALGSEALAKLVIAGKLSWDAINKLADEAPVVANQVFLRPFAQGNNVDIPKGLLNSNNLVRIGVGFNGAIGKEVFRIAIGSKYNPLPSWIPGLVKVTLHIDLWTR
jgi:hypothetical protein